MTCLATDTGQSWWKSPRPIKLRSAVLSCSGMCRRSIVWRAFRMAARRHGTEPSCRLIGWPEALDTAAAVSFTPRGGESSKSTSSVRLKSCLQKSELLSAMRTTLTSFLWERPPPASNSRTRCSLRSLLYQYWSVWRGTSHSRERPLRERVQNPRVSQWAASHQ